MIRRQFITILGLGGIGILSGCSQSQNEDSTETSSSENEDSTETPSSENEEGTSNTEDSETESIEDLTIEVSAPSEVSEEPPSPDWYEVSSSPPSPTYTVAKDGSGDYKNLQDAFRVSKDGDAIKISSGEYTLKPELSEHRIQLIGDSPENTIITIQTQNVAETTYAYWNAHIVFENTEERSPAGTMELHKFYNCIVEGEIQTDIIVANSLIKSNIINLIDSRFDEGIEGSLSAINSIFKNEVKSSFYSVENCRFESEAQVATGSDVRSGKIRRTEFNGIRFDKDPSPQFEECILNGNTDGVALNADLMTDDPLVIRRSLIKGEIVPAEGPFGVGELIGNVFKSGDTELFIQGNIERFVSNAIINGDIEVNNGDAQMYDEEREIGNYYSVFGKKDENGDGIIDLPRPIPGDGGVTDQYPLAEPNPLEYLS